MGFGVGAALLIDATIIRTVLLPSAMSLLGRANWYLPRWLRWLPKVSIEARPEPALPALAPGYVMPDRLAPTGHGTVQR
jgi:RND superfamily putative drug exporter